MPNITSDKHAIQPTISSVQQGVHKGVRDPNGAVGTKMMLSLVTLMLCLTIEWHFKK